MRAEPKKLSAGQRPFVCVGNRPFGDIHCFGLAAAKQSLARSARRQISGWPNLASNQDCQPLHELVRR
jgi:hypothetical protein